MIVSHKHKFIFIKSKKTAGTAIQEMLRPHLGEDDICSPHTRPLLGHMSPVEVAELVGPEIWENYYKIVSVRNPWDAMASLYFFSHQQEWPHSPKFFERFVKWNLDGHAPLNKDMFKVGESEDWADKCIMFENLEADCRLVMEHLGLPFEGVPRVNIGNVRPKGMHYSMIYDVNSRRCVANQYEAETRRFGYKFEHWTKFVTSNAHFMMKKEKS